MVPDLPNASAAGVERVRPTTGKLRKSCDFCCQRKRKCDGGTPCSFCTSRGRECTYSHRLPSRPRAPWRGGDSQRSTYANHSGGGSGGSGAEIVSQPMHWKRARLSASPATGLVGTQENDFLASFFGCLGFLPLVSESTVRQALFELLFARRAKAAASRQSGYGGCGTCGSVVVATTQGTGQARVELDGEHRGDGSTCAFWCAVAMGALVQGEPPERVAGYARLARHALSGCFDQITADTARAFTAMAYLHNFLRDDRKFQKYLQMAKGIVDRLPPEEGDSALDIEDVLMRGDDTRIFHTESQKPGELNAYCEDELPPLKVPKLIRKSALCSFLIQADRKMYKAFLRDHRAFKGTHVETVECQSACSSASDSSEVGVAGEYQSHREHDPAVNCKTEGVDDAPMESTKMADAAEPSLPGTDSHTCIAEAMDLFDRVEEAVEKPEIGTGVGGLLYNAIQAYMQIEIGNTNVGFAKITRCTEIFVKYPGLCRFSTWLHLSHCVMSVLAALKSVERFNRLRAAYNSVIIDNSAQVPPFEEWSMVGLCDHIFCRAIDKRLFEKASARVPEVKVEIEAVSLYDSSEEIVSNKQQQQQPPDEEIYQHNAFMAPVTVSPKTEPRRGLLPKGEEGTVLQEPGPAQVDTLEMFLLGPSDVRSGHGGASSGDSGKTLFWSPPHRQVAPRSVPPAKFRYPSDPATAWLAEATPSQGSGDAAASAGSCSSNDGDGGGAKQTRVVSIDEDQTFDGWCQQAHATYPVRDHMTFHPDRAGGVLPAPASLKRLWSGEAVPVTPPAPAAAGFQASGRFVDEGREGGESGSGTGGGDSGVQHKTGVQCPRGSPLPRT